MSPVEREIIRRKLQVIVENLKALEPISAMSQQEYAADLYKRKATERLLQELVEAAVDINIHILVETGESVPDYYFESFIKVGEAKVISADLAEKLAPSTGLRNRLVHEYDRLDNSIIFAAVRMAEILYGSYVTEIEAFLAQLSAKNK